MAKRLTFRDFKSHLEKDNFYTEKEIRHLFNAVKQMDKETKGWVINWFFTGEYPSKEVEQVTVRALVEEFGYKPLNAFIAIDWLKQDPAAAKYFMVQIGKIGVDIEISDGDALNAESSSEDVVCGLDTRNTGDTIEE
ncbi:MAG: hypothetical protein IKM27_07685 [Clostridia bacterium]|nr:hypothetical protein [Clostridia bacterium]